MPTTQSSQYRHPAVDGEGFYIPRPMGLPHKIYDNINPSTVGCLLDFRSKVLSLVVDNMCRSVRDGQKPIKLFLGRCRCSNGCPMNAV